MFADKIIIPLIFLVTELNFVFNLPLSGEKIQEITTSTLQPVSIKDDSTTGMVGSILTTLTTRNPLKGRDLFEQVNQWNLTNYHGNNLF